MNFARRSGSCHLSGSKTYASGPQSAGLRWVNNGIYMKVVALGIYSGLDVDIGGKVGSAGGSTQAAGRDSLAFNGTGGNMRKVSLITDLTRGSRSGSSPFEDIATYSISNA